MTQRAIFSSSSSSSSFTYGWTYDVFLSFRGEDTRYNFTGNLYNSLDQRGIRTFIDDEELQKGDQLTPALHKAIEESRIAIIIFSENYASSTFCLQELVKIFERESRLILPVFYGVDPSEVRHQRASYGQALSTHQKNFQNDNEKLQKWKLALRYAANLSGWHSKQDGQIYEYQLIERIVKEVSTRLDRTPLHIANYPVGLESRLLKVKSLLKVGSDEEDRMLGIYGIGGIGKTTTARAVYNLIADRFEGLCILANVREKSVPVHGLMQLQETLLSELVGEHDVKLGDVSRGIPILKLRLQRKKVLIILDDVDKIEQLQALAGGGDWFGRGSRIIITTRDKHLLDIHGVKKIYEVKELNDDESLDLLCWNAFKSNELDPSFLDISKSFVDYIKGLPLALEIIGSNLFGKTIGEWNSLLDSYRRIPNTRVVEILKVSYDGLEENEQKIFLDIACFFKGHSLEYVMEIEQQARGSDPSYGIRVLKDKSLIKIEYGPVEMHDLIQDMGREIVRKESPEEPGKRSRLWYYGDIIRVLEEDMGTNAVEAIILDLPNDNVHEVHWSGKAFKKMKNLRILTLKNATFSKGPQHLPNSLRVLEWWGYPSSSLPPDFRPKNLFVLNLSGSQFPSLKPFMVFKDLNVMNFDFCEKITQIPDVSCLPNLTEMSFWSCENLVDVHASIGFLNRLRILKVYNCPKLKSFPPIKLTALEELELSRNPSLEVFPEILGEMEKITLLCLSGTNVKFPCSIKNLTGLRTLVVSDNRGIQRTIAMLPESNDLSIMCPGLEGLAIKQCDISYESLSICLTWFANVKTLILCSTNITILPACIEECHYLTRLSLDYCMHLREIRGIPPNMQNLSAIGCVSLSSQSRSILLSQELHDTGGKIFILPGERIPEWFDHCTQGASISFWFCNKFPAVTLGVVLGLRHKYLSDVKFKPHVIINGNKRFCTSGFDPQFLYVEDHIFVFDLQWLKLYDEDRVEVFQGKIRNIQWEVCDSVEEACLEKEWNHVEVSYLLPSEDFNYFENAAQECGIYVSKQKNNMEDIRFTNPYKDNEGHGSDEDLQQQQHSTSIKEENERNKKELHDTGGKIITFPGKRIPEWFDHCTQHSTSINLQISGTSQNVNEAIGKRTVHDISIKEENERKKKVRTEKDEATSKDKKLTCQKDQLVANDDPSITDDRGNSHYVL